MKVRKPEGFFFVPLEAAPFDVEAPLEGDALKVVSLPGKRWRRESANGGRFAGDRVEFIPAAVELV